MQESQLFISLIEALDAAPTPMAFGEVYTALQSGVIDGAENNEVSYFTQKHYEVAPYFSYTNHLIGTDYLIVNSGVLDRMSEEDRAGKPDGGVDRDLGAAHRSADATEQAIADAEAGGATFTEVDSDEFTEALEPFVDQFLTEDSQVEIYEAARAQAEDVIRAGAANTPPRPGSVRHCRRR